LQVTVVEDLKARVNLELFASAAINYQFNNSIFNNSISITPFQLWGVLSIGPIFDFDIVVQLTSDTVSLNFTYGTEVTVRMRSNTSHMALVVIDSLERSLQGQWHD
jgi:hypothetical protein